MEDEIIAKMIRQFKVQIEVEKNSKGFNWSFKVNDDDDLLAYDRVKKITEQLKRDFG